MIINAFDPKVHDFPGVLSGAYIY